MAERPKLVLAMRPDIVDLVLPAPLRARLDSLADVHPVIVTDAADPAAGDALGAAEILLTGWGAPEIDAGMLGRAPRLAAVIHAAGTVKHHVHPEAWERGIDVSSAADTNAGPVIDFTASFPAVTGAGAHPAWRSSDR